MEVEKNSEITTGDRANTSSAPNTYVSVFADGRISLKTLQIQHIAIAVMLLSLAFSAQAADHTVRLQVNCGGPAIGWHFSQYYGRDKLPISEIAKDLGYDLPGFVNLPFGRSIFRKIRNMDDSPAAAGQQAHAGRMKRGDQFDETFTVTGPGVFIFDVSDWDRDDNIEAAITVDGEVWFSTSSYALDRHKVDASKLENWHTSWTPHVRRTDDREIAFGLD